MKPIVFELFVGEELGQFSGQIYYLVWKLGRSVLKMTSPVPAAKPISKKILPLAIIAVIIVAILLVPVALAGGFTVPVSKVTFNETTGSFTYTNTQVNVSTVNVYEYYLSIRSRGMVQTTDTDVSSSRGTGNITISLMLTNPSNQTFDLGRANISGGLGTRSHTIYLSIDQGVRALGTYKLDIIIGVNLSVLGATVSASATLTSSWTIS